MEQSIKNRVIEVRQRLNLSQEEFGERIGVTRSSVCAWENGRRNFSEQSLKSISREFNVSFLWLTKGVGDIFLSNEADTTAMFDRIMAGSNETAKALFKALSKLGDDEWQVIYKVICDVAESLRQKK